jgi:hypothetical protein
MIEKGLLKSGISKIIPLKACGNPFNLTFLDIIYIKIVNNSIFVVLARNLSCFLMIIRSEL